MRGDRFTNGAGADLPPLQKTMGHASTTVTARIYADLYDDELDYAASALGALDGQRAENFRPILALWTA